MDHSVPPHSPDDKNGFNEEQWLKIIFLISDIQAWLNDIQKRIIYQLPIDGKKKFVRKSFYLTISALAHIMERHYYKIQRYPDRGKFTVPVVEILEYIRDSFFEVPKPIGGAPYMQRVTDVRKVIGFDRSGKYTSFITVLTDTSGSVITAFPGLIN